MLFSLLLMGCFPDFRERPAFPDDPNHDYDGDGQTELQGDCDDLDHRRSLGADEICDTIDNNCNGEVDEAAVDATTWYADADGDGQGPLGVIIVNGSQPDNFSDEGGDCDDSNSFVYEGAPRCVTMSTMIAMI